MVEGWKRECAAKGTAKACYNVAVYYAQMQGEEPKALEYLRPLCKRDYGLGCFNLGGITLKEMATRKESLAAFQKACALSKAQAGTLQENDATRPACAIADVVSKNMDADYMALAAKLGVAAGPAAPASANTGDLTGRYDVDGGTLSILQNGDELWLGYDVIFGRSEHICACVARARRGESGRWQMNGDLVGEIDASSAEIAISSQAEPECCGANWGGVGTIRSRPAPLERCAVKAPKLVFHTADERPTKAYVVAGDKVDAIELADLDSKYVVARYTGKKTITVGLLEQSGVVCPRKQ